MQATTLAQAEPAAAALRPTNRRFRIMGLLFVTVVINYLDRSNISIAAPSIATDFHLDPVQLGLVFSAFSWTYTAVPVARRMAGGPGPSAHPVSRDHHALVAGHAVARASPTAWSH